MRLVQKAHDFISCSITKGSTVIDMTCGNGIDTLYLSNSVKKSGKVFAFDKQDEAILRTRKVLEESKSSENVELIKACHSQIDKHLPLEIKGLIAAITINLGYLPNGDRSVITTASTTITAIEIAYEWMQIGAKMTIIVYRGHYGGDEEAMAVKNILTIKEWQVTKCTGHEKPDSPILYMVTKR